MKITKYPQSCVLINYKGKNILIDPGTFVYEQTDIEPKDWKNIDILLLTHEHFDHTDIGAIKEILENNEPIIITNKSVQNLLKKENIDSEAVRVGEAKLVGDINIKGVYSKHGPIPGNRQIPETTGFLIDDKIYHPGDAAYMKEKPYADVVLVPICGTVVMDYKEAVKFVNEIGCKLAIPIHYSNPKFQLGTELFEKEMEEKGEVNYKILKEKETLDFED